MTASTMPPRRSTRRVARGILALAALLAVTVGVPVVLVALGAVPHGVPSPHDILTSLKTKDSTGRYFRILGAAAVWAAWAIYTAATLKEIASAIRHRGRTLREPRHGLARLGPAALVAAVAAMLYLAAPAPPTGATPAAAFLPPVSTGAAPPTALTGHTEQAPVHMPGHAPAGPTHAAGSYTVKRYDTLWSIAQHHLPGNPAERYQDIKNLNIDAVGPDNEIHPGTILVMPADAYGLPEPAAVSRTQHGQESVPVEADDTLSGIEADHGVGDWHTAWPVNAGRAEPGGERFTDPDHIEPGWTVVVPAAGTPQATRTGTPPTSGTKPAPAPAQPPQAHPPASGPGRAVPDQTSTPAATFAASPPAGSATAEPLAQASSARADHADQDSRAATVRDALYAGGGALLAAGILAALLAHRRRQFRHRRPGRMISAPPAELAPAEKALLTYGPRGAADVAFLDYALRSLSAAAADSPDAQLPEIAAVRLIGDQLELRVAEPHPAAPPAPWTVDESGYWWSVNVGDELPVSATTSDQYLAPYPTLVAIGYESSGGTWLMDLEAAGAVALTGDSARCLALGRFIAAELAVNAWSDQLTVTLVGFGEELVALNPERLKFVGDLDTAAQALTAQIAVTTRAAATAGVDVLSGRLRAIAGDMWMPHVLIVAPAAVQADQDGHTLEQLLTAMGDQPGRSAVAVVLAGEQPTTGFAQQVAAISSDGTLTLPGLGVTLTAQHLPAEQIGDLARLIQQAAELDDTPMPRSTGSKPIDRFIDAGGGLLPEVTVPRTAGTPDTAASLDSAGAGDAAAGDTAQADSAERADADDGTSVLPDEDAEYLRDGAASPEELQAIAPRVTAERRAEIIAADPTLDADLADWLNADSTTPKLRLLGPVSFTAAGPPPPRRIAYHTEVAAYIGTRDHGATAEQAADVFNVSVKTMYNVITAIRNWLGADPATGQDYLPDSTQSPAGKVRGVGVYEFVGVLTDADLFKRLRARAQVGGAEGLRYLQAALDLVAGPPFDQQRAGGYAWLDHLDEVLVVSIVDTAHTAHLGYLRLGDLQLARAAAETAVRAAPYEHTPRLDLAAVMKKEGRDEQADRYLRDEVCNDAAPGEAPEDLPDRTQEILRRRAWLTRAS